MSGISFCTTCRNRLWQIKEPLKHNLDTIPEGMEIVLVDFGSSDGLSEWIWTNFREEINHKKLVFFEVKNEVLWSSPIAKNLAHRLGSKDYLFNLDADNFISIKDITKVESLCRQGISCHQFSGNLEDGSFGRIGLSKKNFLQLGGYDETFLPMAYQDLDLINRLKYMGKVEALGAPEIMAIQNDSHHKVSELSMQKTEDSHEHYAFLNQTNEKISKYKLMAQGAIRHGGFSTFYGCLNGQEVIIDGFNNLRLIEKASSDKS